MRSWTGMFNYVEADGHCSLKRSPPNGCGPGGWLGKLIPDSIPLIFNFHAACNFHDNCYGTWSNHTWSYCNRKFYNKMKHSCWNYYDCGSSDPCMSLECGGPIYDSIATHSDNRPCALRFNACNKAAAVYYWAVRTKIARKIFGKNQFAACPWKRTNPARCWKNIHKRER